MKQLELTFPALQRKARRNSIVLVILPSNVLSQIWRFKTMQIYYLTTSVGQKSGCGFDVFSATLGVGQARERSDSKLMWLLVEFLPCRLWNPGPHILAAHWPNNVLAPMPCGPLWGNSQPGSLLL